MRHHHDLPPIRDQLRTARFAGPAIKFLRERLGLTQDQFAQRLKMHWTSVSRWENNRCHPSPASWDAIEALSCAADLPASCAPKEALADGE